jgi:hypothetical protein
MLSSKRAKVLAAGIAAVVIGGGAYGIVAATSSSATPAITASSGLPFAGSGSGAKGSNARTTDAEGGTIGTVSSVSSSGFTVSTTSTNQKVTVKETSSTSYEDGTSPASASAVTAGVPVLVLGTTDSTTITAVQVIVQPPSSGDTSPGGQVIPKATNLQGASDPVGQIPSDYTQGSGTLVSGTTADKAIEAALAAYPGGVVDRVVELGNGDYEVHNIGVSWPHHIFVNADFQVIGANS